MNNIRERIKKNKVLIVIPTYNNHSTLASVIEQLREYSDDILVVNDGSTDNTAEILDSLSVNKIEYATNKGKGYAIKQALKYASNNGFEYILTMDSDGQHYASDIVLFIDKLEQAPNSLIIGARNLKSENMPTQNTFANRFSNFWYYVETWQKLEDTQSGFRLYPIKNIANKHYLSNRYEFEVEIIVRAAWRGINVSNIPISVYYAPGDQRISHFKPLKDFFRISVVNLILVLLALLYYYPLKFIKACNPSNIVRLLKENLTHTKESNLRLSAAMGLGIFFGIFPIWGYQMVVAALVAHLVKVNKIITLLSSNISIPPMIPFILYGSHYLGGVILGTNKRIEFSNINLETVYQDIIQYLIGASALSVVCGLLMFVLSFCLLTIFRKRSTHA